MTNPTPDQLINLFQPTPWQAGNPPGPGWYLVTVDISGSRETEYAYWLPGAWDDAENVVAWQPLPEPYQGKGKA
jgi:hypothetical protein